MRAEFNRGQILNKLKAAEEFIDDAKEEVLRGAVDLLVNRSPVDTGTYIDNHNIGAGNDTPVTSNTSSEGRSGYFDIEGPAYEPLAPRPERDEARQRMYSQILALPDGWKRASFSNSAMHFTDVEYGGPRWEGKYGPSNGYGVYAQLRSAWPVIKQDAVNEARARSRL